MASLANLAVGDLISLRIYKSLSSNPLLEWANTYEFVATGAGGSFTDLNEFALAYAGAEALMHLSDVKYTRAVVSSWVADGQPYNPESFIVVELAGVSGFREQGSDPLPLSSCFQVKRNVESGRSGRSLYRRVLQESDVHAPAGNPVIRDQDFGFYGILVESVQLAMQTAQAISGLQQAMISKPAGGSAAQVRSVLGLQASKGVVVKKTNNRYFDFKVA